MAFVYWIHAPHQTDMFTSGYIGFTSGTIKKRMTTHRRDSKRRNYPIYNAFKKYGNSLLIEVILEGDIEYCLDVEFKLRPSQNIGWNLNCGGSKGNLGGTASQSTREKFSKMRTGEKNSFFGKKHSDETRKRLSVRRIGTKQSEQSKLNMSITKQAKPWTCARDNQKYWYLADEIKVLLDAGKIMAEILRYYNLDRKSSSLNFIVKRLKSGWNPNEDAEWLLFKENYKKESHD